MEVELPTCNFWEMVALVAVIVNDLWNKLLYLGYSSHFSLPLTFLDCMQHFWPKGRRNALDLNNPVLISKVSHIAGEIIVLPHKLRHRKKNANVSKSLCLMHEAWIIRKFKVCWSKGTDDLPNITGILQNSIEYLNANVKASHPYQR